MPIIEVEHVTKEYQLGALTSFKDNMVNAFKRLRRKPVIHRERFKALDDVSFDIEEGEVVGIIGHNGAGKSTLLKILAKVTTPTRGRVAVHGSVAPLIEVGAGINPELTGRENIYLNASILGIPKKIIHRKMDEIIDFSELEQFIDTPVKRYSSGMKVKLGFAIATSLDAEILIIDEVLAVGDLAFQRKCFDRMEELIKRQGKTVLLVSHNIRQIERLCSRVVLLDKGKIIENGDTQLVCNAFFEHCDRMILQEIASRASNPRLENSDIAELIDAYISDNKGDHLERIIHGSQVSFVAKFKIKDILRKPVVGFGIHTTDLLYLATEISEEVFVNRTLQPGEHIITFDVRRFPFLPGTYSLRIGLTAEEGIRTIFYGENIAHFQVVTEHEYRNQAMREGFIALNGTWHIDNMQGPNR